ncbi:uncharacterized protein H6S33_004599 [Morchella sextelata]|uniref:uncharacterized protein n=1 Tax=Morchella sextelata TaxID=1174677 RepID=UPI001D037405|nr:uncharacterized protein H6S33_004599 [Morchella sextelata]KAH0605377.1 hypothetical protein H6S33_004599 [Morchella sextelata]
MSAPSLSSTTYQRRAPLMSRLAEVVRTMWDLGFISFGGPPVHFQIYHKRFVDGYKWIDEQTYQELFAICQALPGPASTKFGFCITLIHSGFIPALLAFLLFSLPGVLGMFALSLGVSKMDETLPRPVYALLCGLNSATVGIIALAAVQLGQRAVTDKVSRAILFLGATAGMLYNALWYFPLLMVVAGIVTMSYDGGFGPKALLYSKNLFKRMRHRQSNSDRPVEEGLGDGTWTSSAVKEPVAAHRRSSAPSVNEELVSQNPESQANEVNEVVEEAATTTANKNKVFPMPLAITIVVGFFISFIVILVLRAELKSRPIGLSLFANLYLAGTIIFGGGPVVIPLLRQYIVDEGWVTARDFLLGLAIIQAFPGPNFNFAVYLGSLTALNSGSLPSAIGALLAFIAIFAPGMLLASATITFWNELRRRPWVASILRGLNAAAVGLIYTAVYRLWEMGYVDENHANGSSLGRDPWWVVITATSFVGTAWFGFPAPFSIVLGAAMGLIWFVVVNAGQSGAELLGTAMMEL